MFSSEVESRSPAICTRPAINSCNAGLALRHFVDQVTIDPGSVEPWKIGCAACAAASAAALKARRSSRS